MNHRFTSQIGLRSSTRLSPFCEDDNTYDSVHHHHEGVGCPVAEWTELTLTPLTATVHRNVWKLMTITAATTADWVDFWENEMTSSVDMNQEQIAAMLTVSENIQEGIEIAGELWELSDFEVTALCGIVADAFAEQGIKMEALV